MKKNENKQSRKEKLEKRRITRIYSPMMSSVLNRHKVHIAKLEIKTNSKCLWIKQIRQHQPALNNAWINGPNSIIFIANSFWLRQTSWQIEKKNKTEAKQISRTESFTTTGALDCSPEHQGEGLGGKRSGPSYCGFKENLSLNFCLILNWFFVPSRNSKKSKEKKQKKISRSFA